MSGYYESSVQLRTGISKPRVPSVGYVTGGIYPGTSVAVYLGP